MKIVSIKIENFRSINKLTFYPKKENVFIGPNNVGKTALVEAINLALNPEFSNRHGAVDENDFYMRRYKIETPKFPLPLGIHATPESKEEKKYTYPEIRIEIVLAPIAESNDELDLRKHFVAWDDSKKEIVTEVEEDVDPFADGRQKAVWIAFQAMYDPTEDEFIWNTYFKTKSDDTWIPEKEDGGVWRVSREIKRKIAFLIYRDVRALQRPVTLEPQGLFSRIAQSQEALPKNFEESFSKTLDALSDLSKENQFGRLINELAIELRTYLPLTSTDSDALKFELTDRTRDQFKNNAQLYIGNAEFLLPIQKFGAGTRSIIGLGMLTYIMRKRKRGILALEEPETFLYPHAQRRVISESKKLADQIFVTTHSPFILEQFSVTSLARVERKQNGDLEVIYLNDDSATKFYKRHVRKQIAEALLSKAVVVTEEDSLARWLREVSEVLAGSASEGEKFEAFDLAGISVISADGNGNALALAQFLESAGLPVILCLDKTKEKMNFSDWTSKGKPHFILDYNGLEKLLAEELPKEFLETACIGAEGTNGDLLEAATFVSPEYKKAVVKFFIKHKGSIPFHEWMISRLTQQDVPSSLKKAVLASLKLLAHKPKVENSEDNVQADG